MAKPLWEIVPDPEMLLVLEPEEVAGVVLEYLNSLTEDERGMLNRYNNPTRWRSALTVTAEIAEILSRS